MVSTTLWPAVHILGAQMHRAEQRVSLTITSLSLFHFLSLFKFFGPFFGYFWRPSMPIPVLKVPMWCRVTRYALPNDQSTKTDLIFIYGSCFGLLGIWKVVFEVYYAVLPPPQGPSTPKVPIWACTPSFMYCLANQLKNRSILRIWFIFSCFLPFKFFFGHVFWLFLTPLYAYMCNKGLHMDLNSEFYHLSLESAKKRTLIIDYINLFNFFPICGGFCSFGVQF